MSHIYSPSFCLHIHSRVSSCPTPNSELLS